MEKFKVRDMVSCVNTEKLKGNDVAPNLMKDGTYHVMGIILDKEGNQHLDVGLKSELKYVRSYETREELPDGDKIHWCHPSRFIKIG